ncbi:MAG: hypothetical protein JXI43_13415 [Tissierellales bacterium]|nr:hypothetical protein [Tissierellales bacterium]
MPEENNNTTQTLREGIQPDIKKGTQPSQGLDTSNPPSGGSGVLSGGDSSSGSSSNSSSSSSDSQSSGE